MDRKEKRLSRCLSLQIYYAWIMSETHPKEIINYITDLSKSKEQLSFFDSYNLDDKKLVISNDISKYAYKLITSTLERCDEVDEYISAKLKNWDLKRIALIDKLILRLSITEMFFFEEVPPKVSIVEGVEIAKIFSTKDSSSFVNGILDAIYNDEYIKRTTKR